MFDFKYIEKYKSKKDKNHQTGTNIACSGIIPYINIEDESFCFNPGSYFEFYLKCLPKHYAMAELHEKLYELPKVHGWLFPRHKAWS